MNDNKLKNGYCYYEGKEIGDYNIRQYMRLDYLIQLLETRMYHVNKRKTFANVDKNESYNRIIAFDFKMVGDNIPPQPEPDKRNITYREIIECPVSCWTKRESESYSMWKIYATEMGACIDTSVSRLISSLKIDFSDESKNKLICGNMEYKEHTLSTIEEEQLFNKSLYYSEEDEFRFYFHIKSKEGIESNKDFIRIPIDTTVLIDEILLSPFIGKEAANKFARVIKCSYGIDNVKQSNIKIR